MIASFLDFDGVIVNSIDECYQTAWKAYNGFSTHPEEENIKALFYEHRGVVRPAYQYFYLFQSIEKYVAGEHNDVKSYFFSVAENLGDDAQLFEKLFFFIREQVQQNLPFWLNMHSLTEYGKTLVGKELPEHYIVTTKNKKSVELLLAHFNIDIPIIYDKEDYKKVGSKGKVMDGILAKHPEYEGAIFVDDAEEHLASVQNEKIEPLFCSWGYGENTQGFKEFTF